MTKGVFADTGMLTREGFCIKAAEQLAVTHPHIPSAEAAVLLSQGYDALCQAIHQDVLEDAGDLLEAAQAYAAWQHNRIGSEGLTSEGYSGVNQVLDGRLPLVFVQTVRRRRRVRWA